MRSFRLSFSVLVIGLSSLANATVICSGNYANQGGATLSIQQSGDVVMKVANQTANCFGQMNEGRKMKLTCQQGLNSEGEFSENCDSITFNGDTYRRN